MLKVCIVCAVGVLLLGCASKKENALMQAYDEKIAYHKHLQKTEKIQLYDGNTTKAMLTATYLNAQHYAKKDTRDEVFIVGIHLEEEGFSNLQEGDYTLSLNDQKAKSAVLLDADSKKLKNHSFVTEWGSYYLVRFPHVEGRDFTLVFKSAIYGEGVLHFAKVAKYVLSKEAF